MVAVHLGSRLLEHKIGPLSRMRLTQSIKVFAATALVQGEVDFSASADRDRKGRASDSGFPLPPIARNARPPAANKDQSGLDRPALAVSGTHKTRFHQPSPTISWSPYRLCGPETEVRSCNPTAVLLNFHTGLAKCEIPMLSLMALPESARSRHRNYLAQPR